MRIKLPVYNSLALQQQSIEQANKELSLDTIIQEITQHVEEYLTKQIADLSIKSQQDVKRHFIRDREHIFSQLLNKDFESWQVAEKILLIMIDQLDELYDREILQFKQRELLGISSALENCKRMEIALFKNLYNSIHAHNVPGNKEFNDANTLIATNAQFNKIYTNLSQAGQKVARSALPQSEDQSTQPFEWFIRAGTSAFTYVSKQTTTCIQNIAHGKNIVRNVCRLAGGALGCLLGGASGFLTAGAIIGGALGSVAPIVGTIIGTVVGALMGAAIGFSSTKYGAKATASVVYGDTNPGKWQLTPAEKEHLQSKQYDVNQIQHAIRAIRAEKMQARAAICKKVSRAEAKHTIQMLNDDLLKIKKGERANYKLGGKVFAFFDPIKQGTQPPALNQSERKQIAM